MNEPEDKQTTVLQQKPRPEDCNKWLLSLVKSDGSIETALESFGFFNVKPPAGIYYIDTEPE